jgi:hypothetical protein
MLNKGNQLNHSFRNLATYCTWVEAWRSYCHNTRVACESSARQSCGMALIWRGKNCLGLFERLAHVGKTPLSSPSPLWELQTNMQTFGLCRQLFGSQPLTAGGAGKQTAFADGFVKSCNVECVTSLVISTFYVWTYHNNCNFTICLDIPSSSGILPLHFGTSPTMWYESPIFFNGTMV